MSEETIKTKLAQLSNAEAFLQVLEIKKAEMIKELIPPEIAQALDDLEAEFLDKFYTAEQNIAALKEELSALVLDHGGSVKGEYLQAVYRKGTAGGFDTKKLEGYAAAHPEINAFRKPDGAPSVSFRPIK